MYYYLYIFTIIFNVFCELMLLKVTMKQNSFVKITIRSITCFMKIDRIFCFIMTLICKCIVCFACKWDWIWLIWRIIYIIYICFCWGLTIQAFLCTFPHLFPFTSDFFFILSHVPEALSLYLNISPLLYLSRSLYPVSVCVMECKL